MELIEIKGLFEIDYGAPSPTILSNDTELFVAFYADKERTSVIPQERNTIYDTGIVALKFKRYLKYTFGMPGNETIYGHPYSNLGMQSCSFYELRNSDLIKSLQEIEKINADFDPETWKIYKHYILTFHDNMFECIVRVEHLEKLLENYLQVTLMFIFIYLKICFKIKQEYRGIYSSREVNETLSFVTKLVY